MREYQYLIVGGGMTADAAAHGICEMQPRASIGMISAESDPPYNRPPLTKGLWKGDTLESIWRDAATSKPDLHVGRRVEQIDPDRQIVSDNAGETYHYEKLLLATGGRPRRLPLGDDIIYYRTLADYRRLRGAAEHGHRFAVLGSGFIGSEIAAALAMNGKEVVMLFRGQGVCDRVFPADLSAFVAGYYRQKGVQLFPGESVTGVQRRGQELLLKTQSGREWAADAIVAGLGIEPDTELARKAGVQVEDGIVVDQFLQTSRPGIYAAGDVASFHSPALGKQVRVEHEDNANTMGRAAGRNMAGASAPYRHLPFFYSDLFDLGYEAVGELDPRLQVVADWKDPFHEGVLYYQRQGRTRGVLLWNIFGKVDIARELIGQDRPVPAKELREAA
jgi:NADPH-dependent 2,4-dienoyl-CoA reductase/sulfur reductase-like enzyme